MTRTTSYLARHRPICAVLQEIREVADVINHAWNDPGAAKIITLCDEAITYAKRMDAKLVEIRTKESEGR